MPAFAGEDGETAEMLRAIDGLMAEGEQALIAA